jgi:hypothetical protein
VLAQANVLAEIALKILGGLVAHLRCLNACRLRALLWPASTAIRSAAGA